MWLSRGTTEAVLMPGEGATATLLACIAPKLPRALGTISPALRKHTSLRAVVTIVVR